MSIRPQTYAAFYLALGSAIPIGAWLILLFAAQSPSLSATDAVTQTVQFTFSAANPDRLWFVWWAALPVMLLAVAGSYLSRISKIPAGAIALLVVSSAIALASLYLSSAVAIPIAFALYYGFICLKQAKHVT